MAKAFQLLLGLLFIPVAVGYCFAFYDQLMAIRQIRTPELALLLGVTGYLAVHAMLGVPSRVYVFGHELIHAAATWISAGTVKGFHAGSKKGSVLTTQVTAFTALAPYLVPIYSILWAFGYGVLGLFIDMKPWVNEFFFGLGATMAFHLVFTVVALKQKQSDLEVAGPLLSLGLIFLGNITLVVAVIALLISEVSFSAYLGDGLRHTRSVTQAIFHQLFS